MNRALKPVAFVLGIAPFALLAFRYFTEQLSVNPLDDITDETGTWTLRFLVITLAITPLRDLTGWGRLAQLRRMSGLYAYFYGTMHFLTYLTFDKFFEWSEILPDLTTRRFIVVGFTAWILMLPLAITSPTAVTRWMGGRAWKRLHRLVYLIGILGVLHYLWLVKFDIQRPIIYGVIVAVLLGYRVVMAVRKRQTEKPFRHGSSNAAVKGPAKSETSRVSDR